MMFSLLVDGLWVMFAVVAVEMAGEGYPPSDGERESRDVDSCCD